MRLRQGCAADAMKPALQAVMSHVIPRQMESVAIAAILADDSRRLIAGWNAGVIKVERRYTWQFLQFSRLPHAVGDNRMKLDSVCR